METKMEVTKYKCERCGYVWIPRKESPKNCPNCISPYWNKPRTRKATVKAINKRSSQNG